MCNIIEDYAKDYAEEEKAEMLVKHVDTLAPKLGTIEEACEMLNITEQQYKAAKVLLEKILTV